MRAAIICFLLFAVAVSADLQSDIEEVESHFPVKEFISIGKQYIAAYPKYADGILYIQSLNHEQLVKDFLKTKEGHKFIEYFARRGIDAEKYFLFMSKKATEIYSKLLEPIKEGEKLSPVMTGNFRADCRSLLIRSGFVEVVHNKMQTSPEFANLVAAVKDPEYFSLFYRAWNSKGLKGGGAATEVRGFWKKVWTATKVVAVASLIMG